MATLSPSFLDADTESLIMVAGSGDFGSGLAGIAQKFVLTGSASMLAEGFTFPIDITKTRLQLQGQVRRPRAKLSNCTSALADPLLPCLLLT